jgi:hypothetical protein
MKRIKVEIPLLTAIIEKKDENTFIGTVKENSCCGTIANSLEQCKSNLLFDYISRYMNTHHNISIGH